MSPASGMLYILFEMCLRQLRRFPRVSRLAPRLGGLHTVRIDMALLCGSVRGNGNVAVVACS